jgi:hypothetical protein
MLEDIAYVGTTIKKIDFEEINFRPETGGGLRFNISDATNVKETGIGIGEKSGDDEACFFQYRVQVNVAGINFIEDEKGEEVEEEAFRFLFEFEVNFRTSTEYKSQVTTELFTENAWFFDNFAQIEAHKIISNILEETEFAIVPNMIPKGRRLKGENQEG